MIFTIIGLLAPKWVQWACIGSAVVMAIVAIISGDTWLGRALWWLAGVLSGGAVSSSAARKIKQGMKEAGPPPARPPGHVEGDPLPPSVQPGTEAGPDHGNPGGIINDPKPPQFPPGTEVGPDHSPYDPKTP